MDEVEPAGSGEVRLDLTLVRSSPEEVRVYLGDGAGGFVRTQTLSSPYEILPPMWHVVSDLDGNGDKDIVVLAEGLYDTFMFTYMGNGDGTFGAATSYVLDDLLDMAIDGPRDLQSADLDSDGRQDLVTLDDRGITVFLSSATGVPEPGQRLPLGSPGLGDFDDDGILDLLANDSGEGLISLRRGVGDGTFGEAIEYATSGAGGAPRVGDVNGDGRADLALLSSTVSVALGRGDGTFRAAPVIHTDLVPAELALGTVNGDSHLDMVVGDQEKVFLAMGRGDGSFTEPLGYPVGSEVGNIELADVDGNGTTDVVFATYDADLGVLSGTGDGTLGNLELVPGGLKVALGDLDEDGDVDAVTSYYNRIDMHLNEGGHFSAGVSYGQGTSYQELAVADITGNGHLDVVVAGYESDDVTVFEGHGDGSIEQFCQTGIDSHAWGPTVADFTGDCRCDLTLGGVEFPNAVYFFRGLGSGALSGAVKSPSYFGYNTDSSAADFNADGSLDLGAVSGGGAYMQVGTGDGEGNFTVQRFPSFSPAYLAAGDLNEDGLPDLLVTASASMSHGYVSVLLNTSH